MLLQLKWTTVTWCCHCVLVCGGSEDDEDGEEGPGPVGDYEDDDEEEDEDDEESESGEVGLSYLMKDDIQVMQMLSSICSFYTF